MPSRRSLLLLPLVLVGLLGRGRAISTSAGKSAYQRGDYVEAERLFTQALARTPNDPCSTYHRGAALTRLGRIREATTAYETALRLDPPPAVAAAARDGLRAIGALGAPSRPRRTAEETVIRLKRVPGGWLTEVVINGAWTGSLLLDTGASVTLISPRWPAPPGSPSVPTTPMGEVQDSRAHAWCHRHAAARSRWEIESRRVRAVVVELPEGLQWSPRQLLPFRYIFTLDPREGALRLQPR